MQVLLLVGVRKWHKIHHTPRIALEYKTISKLNKKISWIRFSTVVAKVFGGSPKPSCITVNWKFSPDLSRGYYSGIKQDCIRVAGRVSWILSSSTAIYLIPKVINKVCYSQQGSCLRCWTHRLLYSWKNILTGTCCYLGIIGCAFSRFQWLVSSSWILE